MLVMVNARYHKESHIFFRFTDWYPVLEHSWCTSYGWHLHGLAFRLQSLWSFLFQTFCGVGFLTVISGMCIWENFIRLRFGQFGPQNHGMREWGGDQKKSGHEWWGTWLQKRCYCLRASLLYWGLKSSCMPSHSLLLFLLGVLSSPMNVSTMIFLNVFIPFLFGFLELSQILSLVDMLSQATGILAVPFFYSILCNVHVRVAAWPRLREEGVACKSWV